MSEFDCIILGGNLASLVSASELSSQGKRVMLVAPESSIGGHFSSHHTLGFNFDLGMILLEFDSYKNEKSDLMLYDPLVLGSVGGFGSVVESYISRFIKTRSVTDLYTATSGILVRDYYISNNLADLKALFTPKELTEVELQLESCRNFTRYHPSKKGADGVFDRLSYRDCSIENHGSVLHDKLIDPLIARATGLKSEELSAKFHRLFWAPIFYPETIYAAIFTDNCNLRPTTFHYPSQSSISEICYQLYSEIQNGDATVVNGLESLERCNEDLWSVNGDNRAPLLVSSLPQNTIAKALKIDHLELDKSSYGLAFIKLDEACNFNVVFNADPRFHFFRLTNCSRLMQSGSGAQSYIVAEYNLDYLRGNSLPPLESNFFVKEIQHFLSEYNIQAGGRIVDHSHILMEKKLAFPTLDNVAKSAANTKLLSKVNGLELMGSSLGIGAMSLNDQIIQALKFTSH